MERKQNFFLRTYQQYLRFCPWAETSLLLFGYVFTSQCSFVSPWTRQKPLSPFLHRHGGARRTSLLSPRHRFSVTNQEKRRRKENVGSYTNLDGSPAPIFTLSYFSQVKKQTLFRLLDNL